MTAVTLLTKAPLCVSVSAKSDLLDAGVAYAKKRAAEGKAKTRPLSELVDCVSNTVTPQGSKHRGTLFQYIDLAEVNEVLGAIMTYRELPGIQIGSSKVRFKPNDILFAKIRPSIDNKKVAFVYQELENAVASTEFIVLRAKAGVDPYFVYSVLRSDQFTEAVIHSCGGDTGRQRTAPKKLLEIPVPWPDDEQRRDIGDQTRAYFASLATTMALREQAIEISADAVGATTMRTAQPRRKRTKKG